MPLNRHGYTWGLLAATTLGLTACQQPKPPQVDTEALHTHPPATGAGACAALPTDWLSRMPAQQRFVRPADCSTHASTPLFSWGDPTDRLASSAFTFSVRRVGGAVLVQRTGVTEPRLMLPVATLAAGDYEWAVAYTSSNGNAAVTQWRRFSVSGAATDGALRAIDLPEGAQLAAQAAARARPRMLANGSSFAALRSLASQPEHLPVLTLLRSRATAALTTAAPSAPAAAAANPTTLAQAQEVARLVETARTERLRIEALGLVGRLDGQASMISAAKSRLIALATWSPTGATGEAKSAPANREVYLAMAQGFDLLFNDLSAAERTLVLAALRERLLQASRSLSQLDREPYASNGLTSLRHLTQALLLMAGQQGFPEAQSLLDRCWELNRHFIGVWGSDGSHGFGTASAWQELGSQGAFAATARVTTGINLYQIASVRRASEQLIAFTAAGGQQGGAFGDGAERKDFYDSYSASSFRLHAQQSKDAKDAWYWRAKAANSVTPNDASIWQILLLGVDSSPGPTPVPPTSHDWFSAEAGLAAMHSDIRRADRSSVFFRASPFGSYGPAHADQNSLVFVSQGQALLVNAGYTPFVNSPHHKSTRATRYKSALTFDGGLGQAEANSASTRPTDPLPSMDNAAALIRTHAGGSYAAVTGDATSAYQALDVARGTWLPLLTNAVRSVVVDKANGITLVYDWATSATPRQWELNFHSPNAFAADASTVRASAGSASVCIDRYGPATAFSQSTAWDVAPEIPQVAQSHARFTALARSTEFAHLTVLRESCRSQTLQVTQAGTAVNVLIGGRDTLQFDRRQLSLPASAYGAPTVSTQSSSTGSTAATPAPSPVVTTTPTSTFSDVVAIPATKLLSNELLAGVSTAKSLASYNWLWSLECAGKVMGANAVPESGVFGTVHGGTAQELRFGKVADPFDPKRKVLMFKASRSDPYVAGAPRCELGFSPTQAGKLPLGQEVWFAFGVHLPGWQNTGDAQVLAQWHVTNSAAPLNPALALVLKDGDFYIEARQNPNTAPTKSTTLTPVLVKSAGLPITKWTYFVVHAKLSTDTKQAPFLRVWRDGKQIVNYSGPLGYNIPNHVAYGKLGHYHWIDSSNPWPATTPTRTVLMRAPTLVLDTQRRYSANDLLGYVMSN